MKKVGKKDPDMAASQLAKIVTQRNKIARLQMVIIERTASLKAAKGEYENELEKLYKTIDQPELPFPLEDENRQASEWRNATLEELGIGGKMEALLLEAGLDTLGKLSEYCESHTLTEIKGVGDSMAEKISQKLEDYWSTHPQTDESEIEPEESDVDGDDEDDDEEN